MEPTQPAAAAHMATTALVEETARYVQTQLEGNDASHDWRHIERVWTLARKLAIAENVPPHKLQVVDFAALLHDIDDWKYQTEDAPTNRAELFLRAHDLPDDVIAEVLDIIARMGFKAELGASDAERPISIEFGCVQDADRLDAMGAIGIARCFTYGGFKKRPLYDPNVPPTTDLSQEIYADQQRVSPSVNHFYEKLLKLRGLMKTCAGRRLAEERHVFMEQFLAQLDREIAGDS